MGLYTVGEALPVCAISPLTTCSVSTITPHCSRKKAARKSLYRYLTCVTKAVRSTRTEHELMKRRKAKQPNMKFRSSPAGTHTYEVKRICTPSIYAAGTPLAFVHLAFPRRHRATRGSSKASALWHRCQRSRCGNSVQPDSQTARQQQLERWIWMRPVTSSLACAA